MFLQKIKNVHELGYFGLCEAFCLQRIYRAYLRQDWLFDMEKLTVVISIELIRCKTKGQDKFE